MRRVLRVIAPVVALGLSACGPAAQSVKSVPPSHAASSVASPKAEPDSSPTATPASVPSINDAVSLAAELAGVEQAIRIPDTAAEEYLVLGQRQQQAYHLLAARPAWVAAVLNAIPAPLRAVIQDNLSAAQQIDDLNGARSTLPHWRIIAPPTSDVLLGYYRESQQSSGVQWQYLAAINLIETNMGRIQGLSSAGAQGPMQFMPATWAMYGKGDINNDQDAILGAARYLKAAGAPANMQKALFAYNHSQAYVNALILYAEVMKTDPAAYRGYHGWQLYYPTTDGPVLLPVGW